MVYFYDIINMTKYCVYFHIKPIKNEVFYVGIGDIKRPYQTRSRNKHWKYLVNKYGYIIKIIHENLSWDKACELEIKYINEFGRKDLKLGPLVNKTNGADGTIGIKYKKRKPLSKEHKESIKLKLTGRKHSSETLIKLSKPRKPLSNKTKSKISLSLQGKKHDEHRISKMRETLIKTLNNK